MARGVLVNFLPFPLPLSIGQALMGVVIYHIAVLMKETNIYERILEQRNIYVFFVLAISLFVILVNGTVSMKSCTYSNVVLFLMGALGGSISCLIISKIVVYSVIRHKKIFSFPIFYVEWVGQYSLTYLGLNEVMIRLLRMMFSSFITSGVVLRIIILVFTLMLCSVFDIIIRKTPMQVFLGK